MSPRGLSLFQRGVAPTALLFAAAIHPSIAPAQDVDEQTRDHEEQDRRYFDRYRTQAEQPQRETAASEETVAAAYLAKAEQLIRDRNYRSYSSERFRVQTDDLRVDGRSVTELLESFRDFFAEFWEGRLALVPYDERSRVFLFYSFHKYNQLLDGDWRFREVRPKGHYRRSIDAITLHTDAGGQLDLADALIHEAAHQLVEQQIYAGGFASSPWVSEGLATYLGYMRMNGGGQFQPGVIGAKRALLFRQAPAGRATEGRDRLDAVKRAIKAGGDNARLSQVVLIRDADRFYSQSQWTYGASWVLVHYLLHGGGPATADAFVRYLQLEAGGRGGPEALFREIRSDPDALDRALAEHAKRLRFR